MEITMKKYLTAEKVWAIIGNPERVDWVRVPVIASLMDQFDVFKWKERANLRKKLSLEMRMEWYLSIPY